MIGEGDEVSTGRGSGSPSGQPAWGGGCDRVSVYAIVDCRNYDPVATAPGTDSVIKMQSKRTMKRATLLCAVLALMAFTSYPSQSQTKSRPNDPSKYLPGLKQRYHPTRAARAGTPALGFEA